MNKLIFVAALLALTGCNTISGFGQDLAQGGALLSGTATGVQAAASPGRAAPPPAPAPVTPSPQMCEPDANGLVLEGCPQPQPSPQ